jgi:hypothetical protein
MKKRTCALLLAAFLYAAPPDAISWHVSEAPSAPVKAGARLSVRLAAKVQPGWHLYSMKPVPEGPIPTRIWIAEGQPFALAGPVLASKPQTMHDPSFDMDVEFYEGEAGFTLPVQVAAAAPAGPQKAVVSASYQACDNKICLPPKTVKIEVPVTVTR